VLEGIASFAFVVTLSTGVKQILSIVAMNSYTTLGTPVIIVLSAIAVSIADTMFMVASVSTISDNNMASIRYSTVSDCLIGPSAPNSQAPTTVFFFINDVSATTIAATITLITLIQNQPYKLIKQTLYLGSLLSDH
jgi:hypothetical protein